MRTGWLAVVLLGWVARSFAQAPPSPPADAFAKARERLNRDHAAEAISILEQLTTSATTVKGLHHELGVAYYRSSQLVKAQQAFALAIREDPSDKESVQMEGLVLYRLNHPAEAIPYLEQVRQWMPNANADANYVLGLCYLNARRFDDARRAFASQYGEPPDAPEAYLLVATMLMHVNEPDAAADQIRKALGLVPKPAKLPLAHFLLGEVAEAKGAFDEAVAEFRAERDINPAHAPVYDRLADAYTHLDRWPEAQQALIQGISLDRSSTGPFILMGKVLLHNQDTQTALMYLKHAEKMDSSNLLTHTLLAQAYHRAGMDEEARRENEWASKLDAASQPKLDLGSPDPPSH